MYIFSYILIFQSRDSKKPNRTHLFNKSKWFSVVCTLIDNDTRHRYASSQWSKCCGLARRSPQQIATTVMTCIVDDKSTDHAKPHFDLCFLSQYQRQRKCFFFSERELKKAFRDTLTRAALSGLLSTTAN